MPLIPRLTSRLPVLWGYPLLLRLGFLPHRRRGGVGAFWSLCRRRRGWQANLVIGMRLALLPGVVHRENVARPVAGVASHVAHLN